MVGSGTSEADELEAMIVSQSAHAEKSFSARKLRTIWKQIGIIIILMIFVAGVLYREEVFTSSFNEEVEIIEGMEDAHQSLPYIPAKKKPKNQEPSPKDDVEKENSPDDENTEESPSIVSTAVETLRVSRELMMKDEFLPFYGNLTDTFFSESAVNEVVKSISPKSVQMLKTRLKIKFIQSQIGDKKASTFTWVTGGHSAAAGHGNLFNQTYTATLEQMMQSVFKLLNIDFKAKNYAMGGMPSGPQTSLCMDALYGMDIDMLSWDFGMTDGNANWLWDLWIQRAGVHRTRPILIEPTNSRHNSINQRMGQNGMGIFVIDKPKMWSFIPDSKDNPNVGSLPPYVSYWKCGTEIENKDCGDYKYDSKSCTDVKFKASWHWGYREHGAIGRYFSLFLLQNLEEAISELDPKSSTSDSTRFMLRKMEEKKNNSSQDLMNEMEPSVTQEYLEHLLQIENEYKNEFLSSPLPTDIGEGGALVGKDIFALFQREKVICQSAYVPSQARFDGLVTNSNKKGKYQFSGYHTGYDVGTPLDSLKKMNFIQELQPFKLAYLPGDRQKCKIPLNHDYKDSFYVDANFGWTGDIIPNQASKQAFITDNDSLERKGVVILCTKRCDWGKCPKNFIQIPGINKNMTITINDELVTNTTNLADRDCHVLSNKDGYFFPPNANPELKGQYELKVKVNPGPGYFDLSSIIIV